MAIRNVLYGHVELWAWTLVAIVACLVVAVWREWRGRVVAERDLSYTRAQLRRLRGEWARARTPAKTRVLPALTSDDPEEFTRTQIRSVR